MAETLVPVNRGIVIAVDHFVEYKSDDGFLLAKVMRDPLVEENVNGLWVPRSIIDDHFAMEGLLNVARGRNFSHADGSVLKESKPLRVIYDTSSSGGTGDIRDHVKNIIQTYPAPHMTFTLSISAGEEGITSMRDLYAHRTDVDFILQGVYPEQPLGSTQRLYTIGDREPVTEEELSEHFSNLVDMYELLGVAGFGRLARCTRVGQYYLALGVCIGKAEDYISVIGQKLTQKVSIQEGQGENLPKSVQDEYDREDIKVVKRMCSPEETFEYATDTEVAVGRTVFEHNGDLWLPNSLKGDRNKLKMLPGIVVGNIHKLINRLDALPEPSPFEAK